ncbi:palmitoyltransferase ZDHHC5-A-like isoform X2 [Macrobrachium nipponense]|uniref:palmitoyltransferase ZDHHC5-A-like isoform X2 n=1 Tax=Macrobrachium nipponense TaxID=159736 RepID=UPI0030C89328
MVMFYPGAASPCPEEQEGWSHSIPEDYRLGSDRQRHILRESISAPGGPFSQSHHDFSGDNVAGRFCSSLWNANQDQPTDFHVGSSGTFPVALCPPEAESHHTPTLHPEAHPPSLASESSQHNSSFTNTQVNHIKSSPLSDHGSLMDDPMTQNTQVTPAVDNVGHNMPPILQQHAHPHIHHHHHHHHPHHPQPQPRSSSNSIPIYSRHSNSTREPFYPQRLQRNRRSSPILRSPDWTKVREKKKTTRLVKTAPLKREARRGRGGYYSAKPRRTSWRGDFVSSATCPPPRGNTSQV